MDYNRRAKDSARASPGARDIASPRYDPHNRISKPSRPSETKATSNRAKYLTQDEQSRQFVADEDKFVLKQAKKKADIRVREGRAKPIDFLAFNLRYVDSDRDVFDESETDLTIELSDPTKLISELSLDQLKELGSDIDSYLVLETDSMNLRYWKALHALCKDRKAKLDPRGHEGRVVSSVSDDIDRILAPKSYTQLEALEKQIKAKLRSDEDIDADYWEQLLSSLLVWKAKANIQEIYKQIASRRDEELAKQGPVAGGASKQQASVGQSSGAAGKTSSMDTPAGPRAGLSDADNDASQEPSAMYDREAARGISENEEIFTAEEECVNHKPQWVDKWKPRKPKYFNRVQMGYEWNKYNQTHYDHDNPPPKVVQGYKFNIFYPELVDKTKAPTYKIFREHGRKRGESFAAAGEEDTCLIRFMAGAPYEDIAFRIVDREWDYSAKRERGFRSSFDKGILQLHFQFKKVGSKATARRDNIVSHFN
ncbi:mid region of cactin-domain-containing protein [Stachybotrys elegans]|uniref:Splicing factor Cactin n=1 Tax=Stachybotrys elegans TaxID=80388 RepID=A0A8K0WQT0_9HYPO|nr:mid region of cactin-domain-containing protein [Stachybotrys elegans]